MARAGGSTPGRPGATRKPAPASPRAQRCVGGRPRGLAVLAGLDGAGRGSTAGGQAGGCSAEDRRRPGAVRRQGGGQRCKPIGSRAAKVNTYHSPGAGRRCRNAGFGAWIHTIRGAAALVKKSGRVCIRSRNGAGRASRAGRKQHVGDDPGRSARRRPAPPHDHHHGPSVTTGDNRKALRP